MFGSTLHEQQEASAIRRLIPPYRGSMAPARVLTLRLPGLTLLGLLALIACQLGDRPGSTASGPFVVRLVLEDSTRNPAPGVSVQLRQLDTVVTAVTDSAGRATFELIRSGTAMLTVGNGHEDQFDERSVLPLLVATDTVSLHVRMAGDEIRLRHGNAEAPPSLRWSRAVRLAERIQKRAYDQEKAEALRPGHGPDPQIQTLVDSAWTAMTEEPDPEVRGALAYAVLISAMSGSLDSERADLALDAIEPTAAVWGWRPGLVLQLVNMASAAAERATGSLATADPEAWAGRRRLARQRARTYVDHVLAEHPDAVVRKTVLFIAMREADKAGRLAEALRYRTRLLNQFPASAEARQAEADPPGRVVRPGDSVPAVVLPPLDTTEDPIITADLAGSTTLIDFWATWCTPCVAELPDLRELHRRFRDHGLRIISVSYDADRESVRRFIADQPMPWEHSFVGLTELSTGDVASAFGIDGLPHKVLVGPNGRLLAVGDDLRGSVLARTLHRFLGTSTNALRADDVTGQEDSTEAASDSAGPWWLQGRR